MPGIGMCITFLISLMARKDTVEYPFQESAEFQTVGIEPYDIYDSIKELSISEEIHAEIDLIFARATDIVEKHGVYLQQLVLEYECLKLPDVENEGQEAQSEENADDEGEQLVSESDFAELREQLEENKLLKGIYETEVEQLKANYMAKIVNFLPRLKKCMMELKAIQLTLAALNFTLNEI